MRLLFINPSFHTRFSRSSRSPAVAKGGTLYYPIWLTYATGVAEKAGHDARLFDASAEGLSLQGIFKRLKDFIPDLVIVDTSTPSIYNDVSVAEAIKAKFPESFVVLVGTHPSALPEETLKLSAGVDAVCIGEYDYTILDLAKAIKDRLTLDTVRGLAFKDGNRFVRNEEREKIEDLDALPFVSSVYKKHLNYRNYFFAAANYPFVMIMTGRGCPYRCFFCVYPQVFHSRKYRVRSAENVAGEFEYIKGNFPGVKEIGIEDDCLSANPGHLSKVCELLIKRKIKIKWYCNVRGNLDYPLLRLMKKAGCRLLTVGFESGCQEILDNIHKQEVVERYYQFAKDARRAGLLVHGCIMAGNPGETDETFNESYKFALKINCDSMQFYPLYVYPGTEAYAWAKLNGYLATSDFSKWLTEEGFHQCAINLPGLPADRLDYLCDEALKKYHLRPAYLWMKFRQIFTNPAECSRTIRSAKTFLRYLCNKKRDN